jgi:hypothetical protein
MDKVDKELVDLISEKYKVGRNFAHKMALASLKDTDKEFKKKKTYSKKRETYWLNGKQFEYGN